MNGEKEMEHPTCSKCLLFGWYEVNNRDYGCCYLSQHQQRGEDEFLWPPFVCAGDVCEQHQDWPDWVAFNKQKRESQ